MTAQPQPGDLLIRELSSKSGQLFLKSLQRLNAAIPEGHIRDGLWLTAKEWQDIWQLIYATLVLYYHTESALADDVFHMLEIPALFHTAILGSEERSQAARWEIIKNKLFFMLAESPLTESERTKIYNFCFCHMLKLREHPIQIYRFTPDRNISVLEQSNLES